MYKIITTLLLLFFTLTSNSQVIFEAYAAKQADWNNYTEDWSWGNYRPCEIIFVIQDNTIITDDVAGSMYYIYGDLLMEDDIVSWKAVDEAGRNCKVGIVNDSTNELFIFVMYDQVMFKYLVNSK